MIPSILPIWQPVGFSTNLISQRVGEKFGVKSSHTGTIDPMAEGVIIVLLDEERLKKYEYARWIKEYEFEVFLGIETDTFDGMGIITNEGTGLAAQAGRPVPSVGRVKIQNVLKEFIGNYTQTVPKYSTKKIKGKHLHEYARAQESVEEPSKSGEIFDLKLLGFDTQDFGDVKKEVIDNIRLVTGDFRQSEIMTMWEKLEGRTLEGPTLKLCVRMTKGLYVRSLSQDICNRLGVPGFVYKLVRTQNGDYTKRECSSLEDIFGQDYKVKYDFDSTLKTA